MKKIIIIFLILMFFLFLSLILILKRNRNYEKNIINEIKDNYDLKEKLLYLNKYNNYYIFKTSNYIIVLDRDYQEIVKRNSDELYKIDDKYDIIYKKELLMYEVVSITNKKSLYVYYDALTGEKINSIVLGG